LAVKANETRAAISSALRDRDRHRRHRIELAPAEGAQRACADDEMREPNGCWTFRMDYNSFHHQSCRRCARGTTVVETGGSADQEFGSWRSSSRSTAKSRARPR
jgi:hypothetical protein